MTIVQAVLLCFLLAALIRVPEESGPKGARMVSYMLLVAVLVYLLVTGAVR